MRPSFAHIAVTQHARLRGLVIAVALATSALSGCASLPPPTGELSAAQQAVARAESADADQYASAELASARNALTAAQSAMSSGKDDDARRFAETASADAELALARSRAATTGADYEQHRSEIAGLRQRLNLGADDAAPAAMQWPEATGVGQGQDVAAVLSQRLVALDADARLQGLAAYERLQARQSVDALANVRKSDRAHAQQVATARVETAEVAARTAATQREVDRLDRERSELLVEASRQDAERARQEAERLRFEAQVQMEEAQRLRDSVQAESAARQQAEEVILDVTGDQTSKLNAAREKEAALARQEAELTAGASLPPSRRDARGEVFTLAGDAFASGATLSGSGKTRLKALAAYLKAGPVPRVKIEAHTDGQGEADANLKLSQRRADAVRDALAAGGIPKSKMQSAGLGEASPIADDGTASGRARNRRVEIIVSSK